MRAWRIIVPVFFVTFCMVLMSVGTASAVDQQSKKFYSLKFGYYGTGTMTVKNNETDYETDYNTESGIAFGLAVDIPTGGRLMPGFAFDMNEIKIPYDNTMAYNFVVTLKTDFRNSNRSIAIRPGIGGGVALVPEIGYVGNSIHFTFRATNDLIYFFPQGPAMLGEIGLIWDLYGDATDYSVHGGPFLFIRGGFGF